jgi:hypothetical protein
MVHERDQPVASVAWGRPGGPLVVGHADGRVDALAVDGS